jgi:3-hydroxybutyryl-CoA dehydratase
VKQDPTNGSLDRPLAIGSTIGSWARTITEADLVIFSAVTGDWHPQHSDETWASESPFGGRIAHGLLILSYSMGLTELDPKAVESLRGFNRVVFKRPVHPGDTIHVLGEVTALNEIGSERALATLAWTVANQRDEVVVRAEAQFVLRTSEVGVDTRPATDAEPIRGKTGGWDDLYETGIFL